MEQNNYGLLLNQEYEYAVVNYDDFRFDIIRRGAELKRSKIEPIDDYLHCKTLDKKDLLIYLHEGFDSYGKLCHLTTSTYIYGSVSDECIRGIRFTGGIIASLFMPASMEVEPIEKGSIVHYKDDTITHDIDLAGRNVKIKIFSTVNESWSVAGSSLSNGEVGVDIVFEEKLSLNEIRAIIIAMLETCQFMVSRKNVGFDKIELLSEYSHDISVLAPCADVFFQYEILEFTKKKFFECLTFKELGDALPSLFKGMYLKREEDALYFSLDFFAKDDRDAGWFDTYRLKAICTAVESEADRQGIRSETNERFEELKRKAKELLKEFKSEKWMTDRTYNGINSNINNWDYSAYDKYIELFDKYKACIFEGESFEGTEKAFTDGVAKLIKFRNESTHGSYAEVTPQIVDAAYNLMQVIYCSRLDRLGIKEADIIGKLKTHSFC